MKYFCLLLAVALGSAPSLTADPGSGAVFGFGAASVDITPPNGTPMAGYYHARGSEGVLDPIYCHAMVLEFAGARAALVSLDLISITREVTEAARHGIQSAVGIPASHVLISATHAHTGPELAQRSQRAEAMGAASPLAVSYTEALPGQIEKAVSQAVARLQPAVLSIAAGECHGLAYNRRYFMRDGTVGWNPGKLNPNMMLPAGPSDPSLLFLHAEPPGATHPRQALGSYVNFAMHPDTTGGTRISADWPGALARVLSSYFGDDHVTLLGNGACGNINHLDFAWPRPNSGPQEQHRIATILGAAVFQTYKDLHPVNPGRITARQVRVELPLAQVSSEEVSAARALLARARDDRAAPFMEIVRAYRAVDVDSRQGELLRPEVQVLALGDKIAWVAFPGEVFVELGLALRKQSPFRHTFLVTLANENIGYIPDRRSYAEGNYEPESARCAAGSGEKLVAAALDLLREVHAANQVPAR